VELADADGVILTMPPSMLAQHHYSFPVVTGINPKDTPQARKTRMAVYQRFVAELDQNNQHLSEQVSEIDLADPEDLRATMPEQGADILAHFGEAHFLDRLQIYKAHITEWRQRYPKLIGVDLRYNGEVPLEMAGSGIGADGKTGPDGRASSDSGAGKVVAKGPAKPVSVAKVPAVAKAPALPKPEATQIATKPPSKPAGKPATLNAKPKTPAQVTPAQSLAARKAADARKKAANLKKAKAQAAAHKAAAHPAVQQ
jgi:cell division protein FtsQ